MNVITVLSELLFVKWHFLTNLSNIAPWAQISYFGVLAAVHENVSYSTLRSENIILHPKNVSSMVTFNTEFSVE
jgi:hypothetical protein